MTLGEFLLATEGYADAKAAEAGKRGVGRRRSTPLTQREVERSRASVAKTLEQFPDGRPTGETAKALKKMRRANPRLEARRRG